MNMVDNLSDTRKNKFTVRQRVEIVKKIGEELGLTLLRQGTLEFTHIRKWDDFINVRNKTSPIKTDEGPIDL